MTSNRRRNHIKITGVAKGIDAEQTDVDDPDNICSIFWSKQQLDILHSQYPYVILTGDFGTGKTFVLKVSIFF